MVVLWCVVLRAREITVCLPVYLISRNGYGQTLKKQTVSGSSVKDPRQAMNTCQTPSAPSRPLVNDASLQVPSELTGMVMGGGGGGGYGRYGR